MILGVVLAGGQSRRFGSDKALAELDGQTLIAHAVATVSRWTDHVVVVGRASAPAPVLPDWPAPGLGPLGGLAAGLRFACEHGYDTVLSCGVDAALLPDNLPERLGAPPACVAQQPVIGLWPADAAATIEAILGGPHPHSLKALAAALGARQVVLPVAPANINTPADLAALARPDKRS